MVLADGSVIEATLVNEYADLLWAVRGAASLVGIMMCFDVQLYHAAPMVGGLCAFLCESVDGQVNAILAARNAVSKMETSDHASSAFSASFISSPCHRITRIEASVQC